MRWVALGMLCMMLAIACNPAIKDSLPTPPVITSAKSPTVEYPETTSPAPTVTSEPTRKPTVTKPAKTITAIVQRTETEKPDEYGFVERANGRLKIRTNIEGFEFKYAEKPSGEPYADSLQKYIDVAMANAIEQRKISDKLGPYSVDEVLSKLMQDREKGAEFRLPLAHARDDGSFDSKFVPAGGYKDVRVDPDKAVRVTIKRVPRERYDSVYLYPIMYQLEDPDQRMGYIIGVDSNGGVVIEVVMTQAVIDKRGAAQALNFGLNAALGYLLVNLDYNGRSQADLRAIPPDLRSVSRKAFGVDGTVDTYPFNKAPFIK